MENTPTKCRVGIIRQPAAAMSAREFKIYVDGIETTTIKNGAITRLLLDPGRHVLSFAVGSKMSCRVVVDLTPGNDTNVMCQAKGSRVEAGLTALDVCSLPELKPSAPQASSGGSGCLGEIIGLILFLIGLAMLVSIKITFTVVPLK